VPLPPPPAEVRSKVPWTVCQPSRPASKPKVAAAWFCRSLSVKRTVMVPLLVSPSAASSSLVTSTSTTRVSSKPSSPFSATSSTRPAAEPQAPSDGASAAGNEVSTVRPGCDTGSMETIRTLVRPPLPMLKTSNDSSATSQLSR
jgi:hypothetical protein